MRVMLIVISILLIVLLFNNLQFQKKEYLNYRNVNAYLIGPVSFKIAYWLDKYSKEYNVPIKMAYRCAELETNYTGPFDYDYNPYQGSYANAYGVMQIQLPTAQYMYPDTLITKNAILYNVEFNIQTSMKYLNYLYKIYHDWEKVFSVYNQGTIGALRINNYAKSIVKENKVK